MDLYSALPNRHVPHKTQTTFQGRGEATEVKADAVWLWNDCDHNSELSHSVHGLTGLLNESQSEHSREDSPVLILRSTSKASKTSIQNQKKHFLHK